MNDLMFNSDGRVFISVGTPGPGNPLVYHSRMKVTGAQKSLGDIEPVMLPAEGKAGKFEQVSVIRGEESMWTATLSGPKTMSSRSPLSKILSRKDCPLTIHVHYGRCTNPHDPSEFESAIVFEGVYITDYSTTDLIALNSGEKAVVQETISFSATTMYELYKPIFYELDTGALGGQVNSAIFIRKPCTTDCPECEDVAFVMNRTVQAGPTITYYAEVYISGDSGTTWVSTSGGSATHNPPQTSAFNIESDGRHIYAISDTVITKLHFNVSLDAVSQVSIGSLYNYDSFLIDAKIFLACRDGVVLRYDTETGAYETITASTAAASGDDFYALHGLSADEILVGGQSGRLYLLSKWKAAVDVGGSSFESTDITAVYMVDSTHWFIGTLDGRIAYMYPETDAMAVSDNDWTEVASLGGCVRQIVFVTECVGYAVSGYPGEIWRTIDGGNSWHKISDLYTQILETYHLTDIAVCKSDPGKFIVSGFQDVNFSIGSCTVTNNAGIGLGFNPVVIYGG